jgi:hypothetical protein
MVRKFLPEPGNSIVIKFYQLPFNLSLDKTVDSPEERRAIMLQGGHTCEIYYKLFLGFAAIITEFCRFLLVY